MSLALMVTNDDELSPSDLDRTVKDIENKRKEMVYDLLNTACGLFKFHTGNEEDPNSPRSEIGENEMDKEKQLF